MRKQKTQEMAAIVCIYDSGNFDVVSCHYTRHEAQEYLEHLRETGTAEEWQGTLTIIDNGTVNALVNLEKILPVINKVRQRKSI